MPRSTAGLSTHFQLRVAEAQDLVQTVEGAAGFTPVRRFYVYEAAYLLVFSAWENFLEQSLIRFLCGYANAAGTHPRLGAAAFCANLAAAKTTVFGGNQYLLWHDPQRVINRCNSHLTAGNPPATVLASALADIENYAAIRHHIAHRSQDTRTKFDVASRALLGHGVDASRAGRLLRLATALPNGVSSTWMGRICADLIGFAKQIAD